MAVNIACPQCSTNFTVTDPFPGSKVNCPKCNAIIILALDTKHDSRRPIVKPNKPAIIEDPTAIRQYAIKHIEKWLDIPAIQIKNALDMLDQEKAYTTWKIPKGETGLFREITAPSEPLKSIQRRILDRLLYRVNVSNASHGFIQGRSIVTNASLHLKTAGALFNLDLKDAFPSVSALRIKHLFVRYLKIPLKHLGENVPPNVLDQVIEMLVKLVTYKNKLPQGGPCSGYLLNIACITLDKNIYRLLLKYGESYSYSRYADDITISAPINIPETLRTELQKVVHDCGFQINPRKCYYAERSHGQPLEVTGLILEKGKVRIPPQKIEIFRAIIHQASNIAPEQITQEKKLEVQSIAAFVKMVYGKIPARIWGPYREFMDKHKITYPRGSKLQLDLYPH